MTCEERKDLIWLYLTGGLEAGEEAELRGHLAGGCARCAATLAEAEAVLHRLPQALVAQAVPAGAWEKLEMRIGLREQLGEDGDREVLARPFRKEKGNGMVWLGWAAAALVAVSTSVAMHFQNREIADQRAVIDGLTKSNDALLKVSKDYERLKTDFASLEQKLKTVTEDGRTELAALEERVHTMMMGETFGVSGKDQAQPAVEGKGFKMGGKVMVCAMNVKVLNPGREYELWFIPADGKAPVRSVMGKPDAKGMVVFEAAMPAGAAAVAVTEEAAGGADTPTMPIQFLGSLAKQ